MEKVLFKLILTLLLAWNSQIIILAQPRVDGGTNAKVVKSSPIVTNFVGWAFDNINKKWSGYYNCTCGFYKANNKVPKRLQPDDMACFNNMLSLQFKKVYFEGDDYYLLLVPYYAGRYRYPAIEEGWYSKKVTDVYVFTKGEYDKLKNIDDNLTTVISFNKISFGGGVAFNCYYETFSAAMTNLFESKEKLTDYGRKSKFYLRKEDAKTIRFQNLETFIEGMPDKKKPEFSSRYYEISVNNFKQIII